MKQDRPPTKKARGFLSERQRPPREVHPDSDPAAVDALFSKAGRKLLGHIALTKGEVLHVRFADDNDPESD